MRFLQLNARNFGPLKDAQYELDGNVFVVEGHNEAGKSSFHAALESILYGFEQSSRDKHPLTQFLNAGDLEILAKVSLDDGTTQEVHRTLMSQGKLVIKDEEGSILVQSSKNDVLPAIQSVPRNLFHAVYSLTANDTNMQKDEVRTHIQELLLGETGLRGARPIGKVRKELEADMLGLWRSDNRGTPRSKVLGEEIKRAKAEQREAKRKDRELLEDAEALEELKPRREETAQRVRELRTRMEVRALQAEWREHQAQRELIDQVEARLGALPAEVRSATPSDPVEWNAQAEEIEQQRRQPLRRLEIEPKPMPELDARVLESAAKIDTIRSQASERKDLIRQKAHAERGLQDSSQAFNQELKRLGIESLDAKVLAEFPTDTLDGDVAQWDALRSGLDSGSENSRPSPTWILGAVVMLAGSALQAWGAGPDGLGWILIVAGFLWIVICHRGLVPKSKGGQRADLPDGSAALLTRLNLDPTQVVSPQGLARIAERLKLAQKAQEDAGRFARDLDAAQDSLQALESHWRQLATSLGISEPLMDAIPEELAQALARAKQREKEVDQDERERAHAKVQLEGLDPQLAALQRKIERSETLLRTAFPEIEDLGQAFAAWQELGRKRVTVEAEALRLQRNPHFAALQDDESDGEADDPAALEGEIEGLEAELAEQVKRMGALEERLKSDATAHLARADEELAAL
ncbi:MAG: AAA family ATPase, partial [Planctomycetes bacterium]|nr:AAA family ATPase [Planctomycetota bacterium]